MSSVVPPPVQTQGLAPDQRLVQCEVLIDDRIETTRRQVKWVDLLTGLAALSVGTLGLLLAAMLADHWLFADGLSTPGRFAFWLALVAGAAWYFVRHLLPSLRYSVNPVYAAYTIEQARPSFKNALINFILLRRHREEFADELSQRVYQGLEFSAATELTNVSQETAVDRGRLVRLMYVLAGLVLFTAVYFVVQPKNPFRSFGRVMWPWASIDAPTRVTFSNVDPGDAEVYQGETLAVSADVRGLRREEPVLLRYTTADAQSVDQAVPMAPEEGTSRYRCEIPPGSLGLQQSLSYTLHAGDCDAGPYDVAMQVPLAILVESIEYKHPEYTGLPPRKTEREGDIRALEGTRITIAAKATAPIALAAIEFNGDARNTLRMDAADMSATAAFLLLMDPSEPNKPAYHSYALRFSDPQRRENRRPTRHTIETIPDLRPEIRFVDRPPDETQVPQKGSIELKVQAEDPDFGLRRVAIRAQREGRGPGQLAGQLAGQDAGRGVEIPPLLDKPKPEQAHRGPFEKVLRFEPAKLGLKAGDKIVYWAEAADNRETVAGPAPNVSETERQTLLIVADAPQPKSDPRDGGAASQPGAPKPQDGASDQTKKDDSQDPAKSDPGKSDPGKSDPSKTSSGTPRPKPDRDSTDNGPGKSDPDPGKSDPGPGKSDPDPGKSDPGKSDPGKSDPGKSDPGKSDPGKSDPGKSDPGKSDPGKSDPGKSDPGPGKSDPGKSDPGPGKSDPGKSDPGKSDPGKSDPGKSDPGKSDPGKSDPGKSDPGKSDPGKSDPGPGKSDPGKSDPGKSDPGKSDPGKSDPGKSDPGKSDPGKSDPGKSDPGKSDPGKSDPGKSDPGKSDPGKSDPGKSDPDPGKSDPGPGKSDPDPGKSDPGNKDPGNKDSSGPQESEEPVNGDIDPAAAMQRILKYQEKQQEQKTQPGDATAGQEQKSGQKQKPGQDQKSGAKPEKSTSPEDSSSESPTPADSQETSKAKSQSNAKSPDMPATDAQQKPPQDPSGKTPPSDKPTSDKPTSDKPTSDKPTSDKPTSDKPTSDKPASDKPASDKPASDKPTSDKPGSDKPGSDKPGSDKPGSDKPGSDKPGSDKPGSDKPGSDKPGSDKPGSDKPGSDKPGSDKPGSDKPTSDKPGSDKPGSDKPGSDKPGSDKPGAGASTGGGGAGNAAGSPAQAGAPQPANTAPDAPNLEHARQQTVLALQTLEEEMAKEKSPLLDRLGWKRTDAEKFLKQWQQLMRSADAQANPQAKRELDRALKSLGLHSRGTEARTGPGKETFRTQDAGQFPPPPEWADRYNAYQMEVGKGK